MKHSREIQLTLDETLLAREMLALKTFAERHDRDGVIMARSAVFDNGIEADIKLCNGDSPYVDAVLFENGHEVQVLDVSDTFAGEYAFQFNGDEYVVEVLESPDLPPQCEDTEQQDLQTSGPTSQDIRDADGLVYIARFKLDEVRREMDRAGLEDSRGSKYLTDAMIALNTARCRLKGE